MRSADKGKSLAEQVFLQNSLDKIHWDNEAARKDLKATHDKLTRAMSIGSSALLSSMIIEFDGKLPFMLAGGWSALKDLYGQRLQSESTIQLLEQIFLSTFANDDNSHICISWVNKKGAPGKVIADQVKELPKEHQAIACLQFAVKYVENVFFSPEWFISLNDKQKRQLDALAAIGLTVPGGGAGTPLRFDLHFTLPNVSRIFYSNVA